MAVSLAYLPHFIRRLTLFDEEKMESTRLKCL